MKIRKKLIEAALPLMEINLAAAREKSIRHGHPSTLHLWWARRPLAAARAVIFAQMTDDPSAYPELFPEEADQERERQRLFGIIKELVQWESTGNERVLGNAREEIWKSWRRACADNVDHPDAKRLFNPEELPGFHDPFAGGGALPLEAQRLGLEAYASDLNPVAVLINKAMIEIPPRFAGRAPVNPEARRQTEQMGKVWRGALGLAEDVRYYGRWMRDEAEKRIGRLYPKIRVTEEMAAERRDLEPYAGKELTVIAWLWARTVKSPNPAFAGVDVPLIFSYMLSAKPGKEVYLEPVIENGGYRFTVKRGKPEDEAAAKKGTKLGRGANFRCVMSGAAISGDYIKKEGRGGRLGARLMAIVAEGDRGRVYIAPTTEHEAAALQAKPDWKPEGDVPSRLTGGTCVPYGLATWGDLFTPRQLAALTTFAGLVGEAMTQIQLDASSAGMADKTTGSDMELKSLREGGTGITAYAEAVRVYLGLIVDKCCDYWSSVCSWNSPGEKMRNTFGRQAIPMVWNYAEANPFCDSSGNWIAMAEWTRKALETVPAYISGIASHGDAQTQSLSSNRLVSTDPPYYDNIGYADLADFFYVWLRHTLKEVYPDLFSTLTVPKAEELVATPYRHGGKEQAEHFFLNGMTLAMGRIADQAHPAFPVSIYYAFKQSENEDKTGSASTGWETFLAAVIRAGFTITGTWPMRTELGNRMTGMDTNSLASSIVLVCRKKDATASPATRREFISALNAELPRALRLMQEGNIAPVDLAQAAIGPGMAIYTRYSQITDAQDAPLTVRDALVLINKTLDEALAEQEGDFDPDTRWAIAWFDQFGFEEGEYGVAETLSKAKNTSVRGLEEAGILRQGRGKVRLLRPSELLPDWSPLSDSRLTVWEIVHHLIRVLEKSGEKGAAELAAALGSRGETARELAYRLYNLCDRRKRAAEALAYNGLVQSWPEIARLVREDKTPKTVQKTLFS